MENKLAALAHIYGVYDNLARSGRQACRKGCAHCCTCNVAITTLEGINLYDHLTHQGQLDMLPALLETCDRRRYQPGLTINEMAVLALAGEDLPAEENDPQWGGCGWLDNDVCPVYTARPLGCRALNSTRRCTVGGHAEIDPFLLTVANICAQFIEHIDPTGLTGNMADVMRVLADRQRRQAYRNGEPLPQAHGLRANTAAVKLMIPPEHRVQAAPIVAALQDFP